MELEKNINPESIAIPDVPCVSVLMPAYNVEKYVGAAIESILNQTFSDFEFIIINDGSTDDTANIIKKYADQDKRIRFIDNHENRGFIARLNDCLDLARGKYVAKMDSDDISLPERLAKQVNFLDAHPDVGMVGCGLQKFGTSEKIDIRPAHVGVMDFMYECVTTVFMARRDIIEYHHLRFDSNYFAAEDMEFYSRFARVAKIVNLQEVLYMYRYHGNNVSVRQSGVQQQTTEHIRQDIASFLTGDEYVLDRMLNMYHWFRIFGVPIIKIKTYNLHRSKYYLFGFVPLVLIEDGAVYLFGFMKIGIIK